MSKKITAPTKNLSAKDLPLPIMRGLAGLIPFAGSAVSESISLAFSSPAQKREALWQKCVTDTINELIEKVDHTSLETLATNESFLTAVISTSKSAMLTQRKEKIEVLKDVLFVSGMGVELHELLLITFLDLVDRYAPEHILLLRKMTNPTCVNNATIACTRSATIHGIQHEDENGTRDGFQIEKVVPYFLPNIPSDLAQEIFGDLARDGLCHNSQGFAHVLTADQSVTDRGRAFLKFITKPSL